MIFLNLQFFGALARKRSKSVATGKFCMSECIDGYCKTGRDETYRTECHKTNETAPTYFTAGYNQREEALCVGECAQAGFYYNWCFTSSGEWDRCSREYGKSSSGELCHTHCQINDKPYYTCTTDFNSTFHYVDVCSPIEIDKPSNLHLVAELKNHRGICMSTCNGYCYYSWAAHDWDKCNPTGVASLQYFTTGSEQKQTKLCSGECSIAGHQNYWCFTVNRYQWDYCSPSDATTFNYKRCFSECRIEEKSYYTCLIHPTDKTQYERCSPKPIDQAKTFEFNQYLERLVKTESLAKHVAYFSNYFYQLNKLFHKTIINDNVNGSAKVTYYHDYVDGVKIVRGVEARIEREIILKNKTKSEFKYSADTRFLLQAHIHDNNGYFIDPTLGGSTSEAINSVPLHPACTYDQIQENVYQKVTLDNNIIAVNFKVLPYYSFNGHRPLGFIVHCDYETGNGEPENREDSYQVYDNIGEGHWDMADGIWDMADDNKTPQESVGIIKILYVTVVVIGLAAVFLYYYFCYLKK